MSSSYVEFLNKGFWSWDGYLEDVLLLLADAVDAKTSPPWLCSAQQHWKGQVSIWGGVISPGLDELLTTDERKQAFIQIASSILTRNDLTSEARETLKLFVSLVKGEVETDASSPLEYMVSGEHPYRPTAKEIR